MSHLLHFFQRDSILKLFFLQLLVAILILGDGYVLVVLAREHGVFLMLAIAGATGIPALVVILNSINAILGRMRRKVREGEYPAWEYTSLFGVLLSGFLWLIPGFFTDFLGLLVFICPIRNACGWLLTQRLQPQLKQIYEYIKLDEFG